VKTKKTATLALVLLMVMLMCWMALLPREAVAAGSPAIMQGTSKISTGNTVWFGNHYTSWSGPIQWRVMGNGNDGSGNSRLFLSSHVFDLVPFKPQDGSNGWLSSFARGWCIDFHHNAFSYVEKAALIETSLHDAFYTGKNASFDDTVLRNDRVFFLSAEEVETIYFPQDDDSSRIVTSLVSENPAQWWLRSPVSNTADYAGAVDRSGEVFAKELNWESLYARPAFNFNLSSVLLTSAAEGGKLSGSTGQDALTAVPSTETTDWKLTLFDPSRLFSATWSSGQKTRTVGYTGWTVDLDYSRAKNGTNEKISALLCKKDDGTVLYYGQLKDDFSDRGSGRVRISIPTGLAIGEYQLKVFNEQANGDKQTDYASRFSTFDIEVEPVFVTDVKLSRRSIAMLMGNTETLTATVSPENATNKKVIWSSSDIGVAAVDENGEVTARTPGIAIITAVAEGAEDGDRTASCWVTVIDPASEEMIIFDPAGGKWSDGTTDPKIITADVGDEITILEAPFREGYEFQYWEGSRHQPGERYLVPSGGHTFTAIWTKTEPTNPTQPDLTSPDPTQPDPTQPDPTSPDPTSPYPTQPDPTNPDPTQSDPAQSDPTQPDPTQPDPTQSDPASPDPAQPGSTNPDPMQTDPTRPGPTIPGEIEMIQQPPVWIKGSNVYASFISSADFADFLYVKVDGIIVDESNYDAKEGSTIVTFQPTFLETLSIGKHPVVVVSKSGTAYGMIEIKAKAAQETEQKTQPGETTPKTGENKGICLWPILLFIVAGTLLFALRKRKTSQPKA
jgi:hypothetical protein